jgi:hypothetical protein
MEVEEVNTSKVKRFWVYWVNLFEVKDKEVSVVKQSERFKAIEEEDVAC